MVALKNVLIKWETVPPSATRVATLWKAFTVAWQQETKQVLPRKEPQENCRKSPASRSSAPKIGAHELANLGDDLNGGKTIVL